MDEVAVIGAGIAGLAAATAMAQRGFKVQVFEQAEAIKEVGAGVQISPNGAVVLRALGCRDDLAAKGIGSDGVDLRDGVTGKTIVQLPLTGQDYHFLLRSDLIEMLHRVALAAGVKITLGQKITNVALDGDTVNLTLSDGSVSRQKMVIAADGVHSAARAAIDPPKDTTFTGQVAWRSMVAMSAAVDPAATVHVGAGRHLVHYPVAGGRFMNIVGVLERPDWIADGWNTPDSPSNFYAAFDGFAQPVLDLLSHVEQTSLWGLHLYPDLPCWFKGNLVLIGDAAHPMLPFLGQGANMALEDAYFIATCLATSDTPGQTFEARRRPRVQKVVAASQANARNYHLRGLSKLAAHSALRTLNFLSPRSLGRQFNWLYSYDVTGEGAD